MGQLVYMFYGLLDVGEHDGVVLLGTARSVDAERYRLELEVERRWERGRDGARVAYTEGDPRGAAVGSVASIALTPPVEWTDPRRSPVQQQLAQALSPTEISDGDRILVVGHRTVDAMEASARNIEIVEMAFDPARRTTYLQTASESQLVEDLSCPHLQALVREHFARHGGVPAAAVLESSHGDALRIVLVELFQGFDYRQKARFLADAATYFAQRQRPWEDRLALVGKRVADMMHAVQERSDAATWKVLATLASLLSPHEEAEAEAMYPIDAALGRMCERKTSDLPLEPFNPLMASYVLFEYSDTGSIPRYLKLRLDRMSAAEHEDLLTCLAQAIEAERSHPRPRGRTLDRELFEVVHEAFDGHRTPTVQVRLDTIAQLLGA